MIVLLIGDFHIPSRADKIPDKFINEMRNSDLVLCTGDFTNDETFEKIKNNSPDLRVVRGNCDFLDLPSQDLVEVEGLRIGLVHGDQFGRGNIDGLVNFAKRMNVDLLVSGHTHQPFKIEKEGILLLNPGTSTGAWSGGGKTGGKSCMKLKVENGNLEEIEVLKA